MENIGLFQRQKEYVFNLPIIKSNFNSKKKNLKHPKNEYFIEI